MYLILKIGAAWFAIWALCYIAGSFTAASFNINDWTYSSRSLIALYAAGASGFSAVCFVANKDD